MAHTRFNKSIKNAKVNLTFYVVIIFISFFSRKIFLQSLGDEFIGVTSTLANIIGVINLAELGVSSAVAYMLYKPLFDDDRSKINEIISIFGYIYQKIGVFISIIILLLIPFLHLFFKDVTVSLPVLYFAYLSYAFSSLLGYFVNYKQLLLGADQRNYEITRYYQLANITRLIIQMAIAYYTKNYYLWIVIEIVFSILYSIIITKRINKIYPFLQTNLKNGKGLLKKYPELIKRTKQIFVHSLAGVVLSNISPLILYSYTSAVMVAYYTNYTIILSKLQQLVSHLLGSMDAAIGSVIAEGKKEMIQRVYWEITSIYYLIGGVVVVSLYFLIDPFVYLLFGGEYVISGLTVIIILFNFYIGIIRASNGMFLSAYGLFHDILAPISESIINLSCSILGGIYFGINGVLLGTTISFLIIVCIWKPYFLFKRGFKESVSIYWYTTSKYLFLSVIIFLVVYFLSKYIAINPKNGYLWWTIYAGIIFSITSTLFLSLMLATSKGMRDAVRRIVNNIVKK